MMTEKRKTYTAEFKHEAVRLVTEQGYGVSEAARNLGLNINMLRRWKRELSERANGAFPGKGHLAAEQEELHRRRASCPSLLPRTGRKQRASRSSPCFAASR